MNRWFCGACHNPDVRKEDVVCPFCGTPLVEEIDIE